MLSVMFLWNVMRKIDKSESIPTVIIFVIAFVLIGSQSSWYYALLVTFFFCYFFVGAIVGGHIAILIFQKVTKKDNLYLFAYIAFPIFSAISFYDSGMELTVKRSLSFLSFGIFLYVVMYFFYNSTFSDWYAKKELEFKRSRKKSKNKT